MPNRRRHHRPPTARILVALTTAALFVAPGIEAGAAPNGGQPSTSRLRELQKKREEIRTAKARSASNVDALKASNDELTNALAAITRDIDGQTSMLEEAERAVQAATAEQAAADAAVAQAEQDLADLRRSIKRQAIDAYVHAGSSDQTLSILSADDLASAAREHKLREVRTSSGLDATEKFRAVQEDLGIARERAAAAAATAQQRQRDAQDRMQRLQATRDQHEKFAEQVESRLERSLAEASVLAGFDDTLSGQIQSEQDAIARQLAAQRAAAARRAGPSRSRSSSGSSLIGSANTSGAGIVSVRGIRVHQSIAGNLEAMLAAAEADGIHLSGGGYRDPAGQIAVRRSNCGSSQYAIYSAPASSCRPPTARPGASMHERGLAIDFSQNGRTLNRGSSAFAWLKANAGRFGFQNLPSEPWHWSTNGN